MKKEENEYIKYSIIVLIEFITSTIYIFLRAGSVAISPLIGGSNILVIAFVTGFSIYAIHATYLKYKTGYVNILIAIAYLFYDKKEKSNEWMMILIKIFFLFAAQLVGSIIAALLVWGIIGDNGTHLGKPTIGSGLLFSQALGYEILGTFILITTSLISNAKYAGNPTYALITGLLDTTIVLVGIPISGASLNYARHFGPTLISNSWVKTDWIYYVGPTIGALVAWFFIWLFFAVEDKLSNNKHSKS